MNFHNNIKKLSALFQCIDTFTVLTFLLMMQKPQWVKFLMLLPESKQWYKTILLVIVIIRCQVLIRKKCQVHLTIFVLGLNVLNINPLVHVSLFLGTKMRSTDKAFLLHTKVNQ